MSFSDEQNEGSLLSDPELEFASWDDDLASISINDPSSQPLAPLQNDTEESVAGIDEPDLYSLPKPIPSHRKIGTFGICVLISGYITSLGSYAFLCFLWTSNENNSTWRWIIITGLIKAAVTISSGVIRTSIAAQSTICTSMLAALMMEMVPFTATSSAILSIKRFAGGDPWTLLLANGSKKWILLLLIISTCLNSIVSQFISTFLISDLAEGQMSGDPRTYRYPSTSPLHIKWEPDWPFLSPPSFPTFAEYTEPSPQASDVDDTGVSLRGLLPIGLSTIRESIHNYSGMGTILNSRVVCMRPSLRDITISDARDANSFIINGTFIPPESMVNVNGIINGTIKVETHSGVHSPLMNLDQCSLSFSCPLSLEVRFIDQSSKSEWPLQICSAESLLTLHKWPEGWPKTNSPLIDSYDTADYGTGFYLFANITNTSGVNLPVVSGLYEKAANISDISTDGSIWDQLSGILHRGAWSPEISVSYVLSLSLCVATFDAIDTNITASSPANNTEPTTFGSFDNSSSLAQVARQVSTQLGADGINRTFSQRGILELQKQDSWLAATSANLWNSVPHIPQTVVLCQSCTRSHANSASDWLMLIFQNSLISSGSLARALQAMLTTVAITRYYAR